VQREDDRARQGLEQLDERLKPLRIVDVARPVGRREDVLAMGNAVLRESVRPLLGHRRERERHVGHRIAYEPHLARHPLALEVRHGRLGRAQQQVAGVVGEHAVQLLGHAPVERPHPRLHVRHRHVALRARQGARERGVGVAVDEHHVGPQLFQLGLQRGQHPRGLAGGRSVSDV
jgi:hypothetical protein